MVPVRRIGADELVFDYVDGFAIDNGIVADTDIYLEYLMQKAKQLGVQIVIREVC